MTYLTLLGLIFVTGFSTVLGSTPVLFHKYLKDWQWHWWESFGGGVMVSASVFSLFLPAYQLLSKTQSSYWPLVQGGLLGIVFIFGMAFLLKKLTANTHHQRAFLFVFVMGIHNIPEGLAVGVDVAAVGWRESLPLTIAIFIQNLPEGLVSSMRFLISGFSVKNALLANGLTAVIEAVSALFGFSFTSVSSLGLPLLFSFSGACMMSVVAREIWIETHGDEAAVFSWTGFSVGVSVCALLDVLL